jgi:hypothetical protein
MYHGRRNGVDRVRIIHRLLGCGAYIPLTIAELPNAYCDPFTALLQLCHDDDDKKDGDTRLLLSDKTVINIATFLLRAGVIPTVTSLLEVIHYTDVGVVIQWLNIIIRYTAIDIDHLFLHVSLPSQLMHLIDHHMGTLVYPQTLSTTMNKLRVLQFNNVILPTLATRSMDDQTRRFDRGLARIIDMKVNSDHGDSPILRVQYRHKRTLVILYGRDEWMKVKDQRFCRASLPLNSISPSQEIWLASQYPTMTDTIRSYITRYYHPSRHSHADVVRIATSLDQSKRAMTNERSMIIIDSMSSFVMFPTVLALIIVQYSHNSCIMG